MSSVATPLNSRDLIAGIEPGLHCSRAHLQQHLLLLRTVAIVPEQPSCDDYVCPWGMPFWQEEAAWHNPGRYAVCECMCRRRV